MVDLYQLLATIVVKNSKENVVRLIVQKDNFDHVSALAFGGLIFKEVLRIRRGQEEFISELRSAI